MTIKELEALFEKGMVEMKELDLKVADAEDKEAATKAFEDKRDEVLATQKELEVANEKAEMDASMAKTLEKSKKLGEAIVPDGKLAGKGLIVEEIHSDEKEMRHAEKSFRNYIKGGEKLLSGVEMDALRSTNSRLEEGAGGAKMPKSMAYKMMGHDWAVKVGYSDRDIALIHKASTMVSSTDALGGYLVPEDYRPTIQQLPTEQMHILPRATVIAAPTGEVTMPKAKQSDTDEYSGFQATWINEAGSKPATNGEFEQIKIQTHELALTTEISHTLQRRSVSNPSIDNWITDTARASIMDETDKKLMNGLGVGTPLGILQTDGIRTLARITPGTVVRKDMTNLKFMLKPYHRANGVFVMDDSVLQALENLEDTDGRQLFTDSMADGPYSRVAGYPYVSTTRNPDIGSEGDVFFCDLRQYIVPMEQDIVVKYSDAPGFTRNVGTYAIFLLIGGELIHPRVCAALGNETSS